MGDRFKQIISQCVSECFPSIQVEGNVYPLYDFKVGLIGTNVCQKIAAATRNDTESIANTIITYVKQQLPGTDLVYDNGFINVVQTEDPELLFCEKPPTNLSLPEIVIPGPSNRVPIEAYIRLIAFPYLEASLQLLYGSQVHIIQAGKRKSFNCNDALMQSFKETALEYLSLKELPEHDGKELAGVLESSSGAKLHIWLTPRILPLNEYNAYFKASDPARYTFCCPGQKFFSAVPKEGLQVAISQQPMACAYYSVCSVHGLDLDWNVPLLSENSNLVWFSTAQVQRGNKLLDRKVNDEESGNPFPLTSLSDDEKMNYMLFRCYLQERFTQGAAFEGRVLEWYQASELLLKSSNYFFNSPKARFQIEKNGNSGDESKILTGVLNLISDKIIPWDLPLIN